MGAGAAGAKASKIPGGRDGGAAGIGGGAAGRGTSALSAGAGNPGGAGGRNASKMLRGRSSGSLLRKMSKMPEIPGGGLRFVATRVTVPGRTG
jgi:hypothetical protein